MSARDIINDLEFCNLTSPSAAATADNTAVTSKILDRLGYQSAAFLIVTGTLADADATFAVQVQHSDDTVGANFEAVGDADLAGTEALAGFQYDDDDECRKIGYVGDKRYVRVVITPSGNSGNAPMAITGILHNRGSGVAPNPPSLAAITAS